MSLVLQTLLALAVLHGGATSTPAPKENRLFELRTYYAAPGKLDALNARFRDHTTKLFEKHGITNIGYWVPADNKDNLLIYLIAFPSKEAREQSWKAFGEDPDWKSARDASEVNGKLVVKVVSQLLTATDYSARPKRSIKKPDRVFELRTYKTFPGKLEDLHTRFREHTVKIIKRFGADLIGFWVPTEKEQGSEDTLIYLLAHKSKETMKEMAEKFPRDPEWVKAKEESEKNGKLVEKVESLLLTPVDYSTIK